MERRTVVAAASAISMALVSATVAVAANVGALGFSPSAATTQPSAVSAPVPPGTGGARVATTGRAAVTDRGEREHEGPSVAVALATSIEREGHGGHD